MNKYDVTRGRFYWHNACVGGNGDAREACNGAYVTKWSEVDAPFPFQ